jgi:alkanesulfonate monooxygenase SsuD/methylene tetrahydromethanopterin reductase-like flavin-dependent oxidoreductase (luciferase family)
MLGAVAGPDAITRGAQRAEALGYHSVWVADRLLYPVAPRSPYPVGDGVLPEYFKRSMDPVEALTFAAAHTRRITLGTSVLNMPFYQAPLDDAKRSPLSGSAAQVRDDLARLGDARVSEVIAWTGAPTLDGFLAGLERFREAAG